MRRLLGGLLLLGLLWSGVHPWTEPSLLWRRTLGLAEHAWHPGYSTCQRCWRPWTTVEAHSTEYVAVTNEGDGWGMFPLCEFCWTALGTPHARLPYYMATIDTWARLAPDHNGMAWEEVRAQVHAAVLRGE